MIKYITVLDTPSITLELMGRKKEYKNSQEVNEDIYIKSYPQYFKKIGEMKGYSSHLAVPRFVPIENDPIKDFVNKEEIRKTEKKIEIKDSEIQEVKIDKIAEAAEEIEDIIEEKYDVDIDSEEIEDIIEEVLELDVKIETEE